MGKDRVGSWEAGLLTRIVYGHQLSGVYFTLQTDPQSIRNHGRKKTNMYAVACQGGWRKCQFHYQSPLSWTSFLVPRRRLLKADVLIVWNMYPLTEQNYSGETENRLLGTVVRCGIDWAASTTSVPEHLAMHKIGKLVDGLVNKHYYLRIVRPTTNIKVRSAEVEHDSVELKQ